MQRVRGLPRRTFLPRCTDVFRLGYHTRHVNNIAGITRDNGEPAIVRFESNLAARCYVLDPSVRQNSLGVAGLATIRSHVQGWDDARLCEVILGINHCQEALFPGRDVSYVAQGNRSEQVRSDVLSSFKEEFEIAHLLGTLATPYVAVMNGITTGGGAGLALHAPFRVATENTIFAMPRTRIGYIPDGGANYLLSKLDGQLGTYLALTACTLKGRAVFEHGIATHFIPASRIPDLIVRLSALEKGTPELIEAAIEELHFERSRTEPPACFTGKIRTALDFTFSKGTLEEMIAILAEMAKLSDEVGEWAKETLGELKGRSPGSLRIALEAVRRSGSYTLSDVLQMEMTLVKANMNGAIGDVSTGTSVEEIVRSRWDNEWAALNQEKINDIFRDAGGEELSLQPSRMARWGEYGLVSEEEIGLVVTGSQSKDGKGIYLEDVEREFYKMRGGKHGLRAKVQEVVSRCCRVNEKGKLEWAY